MAVLTKKSPYTNVTHQQQTHFVAIPGTTLHLYKPGHGNLHILDSDDQTSLYDIKTHTFSSPDISLYHLAAGPATLAPAPAPAAAAAPGTNANANSNNAILCGTAKFHWSGTIELQIIGAGTDLPSPNIIPFKAPGILSSSRTFESCIGELKWKQDMRLLNAKEEVVATFTHVKDKLSSFIHLKKDKSESKKLGWFEMAPQVAADGGQRLVDEIVLSGVALLEYERRATKYGAVGEAVGGVGEGVGAAVGG